MHKYYKAFYIEKHTMYVRKNVPTLFGNHGIFTQTNNVIAIDIKFFLDHNSGHNHQTKIPFKLDL